RTGARPPGCRGLPLRSRSFLRRIRRSRRRRGQARLRAPPPPGPVQAPSPAASARRPSSSTPPPGSTGRLLGFSALSPLAMSLAPHAGLWPGRVLSHASRRLAVPGLGVGGAKEPGAPRIRGWWQDPRGPAAGVGLARRRGRRRVLALEPPTDAG